MNEFMLIDKNALKKISIEDITLPLPNLKDKTVSKAVTLSAWLAKWILSALKSGTIAETYLMPKKEELAYYTGVSIGTVQNAMRILEDQGFVFSKQCIGTMVKSPKNDLQTVRKFTSKRDIAVDLIKNYIVDCKIKIGHPLPSYRALADIIKISPNTTRLALESICTQGIIEHKYETYKDGGWVLKSRDFDIKTVAEDKTLVNKIEKEIKDYIQENLKIGDKIPSHNELSKRFKVSIKTIHDSLNLLVKSGILLTRRGRYGTSVIRMPNQEAQPLETSIFAPAQDAAFYHWEKTYNMIKNMIAQDYEIGAKLPSIIEFSKQLDLSPNTIRKAFAKLSAEGILRFSRGRWGGTFVVNIPEEIGSQAFKWIAVNPRYAEVYKN